MFSPLYFPSFNSRHSFVCQNSLPLFLPNIYLLLSPLFPFHLICFLVLLFENVSFLYFFPILFLFSTIILRLYYLLFFLQFSSFSLLFFDR